jgi:hypothetical protein
MAKFRRTWRREKRYDYRTLVEDAGLVLALVIIAVLGMTLVTVLLLAFYQVLPGGFASIFILSLIALCAVIGRALMSRSLAVPPVYRSSAPNVRYKGR